MSREEEGLRKAKSAGPICGQDCIKDALVGSFEIARLVKDYIELERHTK